MNIDDMSYRQWQKRNTEAFRQLNKDQQTSIRNQGYFNVGWQRVQESWKLLQNLTKPPTLFDAKLKKGDLVGALNQSIFEAEKAQEKAQQAVVELEHSRNKIKELAETTLNKYQLQ
ncbi:hypothetical protein [Acaryochloris marina]|uniref:hypothetical protein n=1 Tax=Acaryochloris marina TaxID=155978 RepID=UPI0021C4AEFF|nr:hypothetical protein [Acaryochloris marina]BDM83914.1 hypothetical protein AM10699_67750 [Acaryochloris marina MBIC10699]